MEGCEGEEQDIVRNTILNGEPVTTLQHKGYLSGGRGFGNDASARVLDHLEFMDGFCRRIKKKGVSVRCNVTKE